ncbi:MAG: SAM-dependent chlorinase/fluorinase [Gemmatimonadota bacterium]|nr:SAM-dependent chlorinase/fluorinase [Gemmatimonadota bacterium]
MSNIFALITLTTDFGTRDGYVGAMKGVIHTIAPGAAVEDITHGIPPGDVAGAALALETFHTFYPPGTVHMVVVDPEVGSSRKAMAVRSGGRFYVGPDNGVLEAAFDADEHCACRELTGEKYRLEPVSPTFHGRDIFAPAAAHLAAGLRLEELGPELGRPVRLEAGHAVAHSPAGGTITGRVVHIDRFGNLVTDIRQEDLGALGTEKSRARISCCGREILGIVDYYAQGGQGELVALIGSNGRLEVALRGGSAAGILGPESSGAVITISKQRS